MHVTSQTQYVQSAPPSKVQDPQGPTKVKTPAQEEMKPTPSLSDKILTNITISSLPPQQVFFGSPEDLVHETVNDILLARENGKGHWCGTPMMMDIMFAHDRFDSMVAQQDQKTLEKLRDYIVNEMSNQPSQEVREILHQLYQSVDKAVEMPEASETTGPDKELYSSTK